jgi:hypothetical protein
MHTIAKLSEEVLQRWRLIDALAEALKDNPIEAKKSTEVKPGTTYDPNWAGPLVQPKVLK